MRWIFILLLVVNGVLLMWRQFAPPTNEASQTVAEDIVKPEGARLQLVSEVGDVVAFKKNPKQESNSSKRPLCRSVGAFSSLEQANDFIARLKAIDVKASIEQVELTVGESYWVYLPSEGSRADARRKLAELQALKIDSYIIPKGELENGISLGVFSRSVLAQRRIADMKQRGLSPLLHTTEKTNSEIWVFLEHEEEQKLDEKWWESLVVQEFKLDERQNFCLAVASQENFH